MTDNAARVLEEAIQSATNIINANLQRLATLEELQADINQKRDAFNATIDEHRSAIAQYQAVLATITPPVVEEPEVTEPEPEEEPTFFEQVAEVQAIVDEANKTDE